MPKRFIKKAAEYLRQDILLYQVRSMKTSWPPTVEELSGEARDFPENLMEFFTSLFFEDKRHQPNDYTSIPRLIDSYMADRIHAVTRGKVMTAKHFVLGMGLHNMTRSKKLIQLINKLGHCIDYNAVCDILTAQAQKSSELAKSSSILHLTPISTNNSIKTWFWVDNYDEKVETNCGGGSVNITALMAFQEKDENAVLKELALNVPKTKNSAPIAEVETEHESLKVDPKKELPLIPKVETPT